jgi:hypothetical protein
MPSNHKKKKKAKNQKSNGAGSINNAAKHTYEFKHNGGCRHSAPVEAGKYLRVYKKYLQDIEFAMTRVNDRSWVPDRQAACDEACVQVRTRFWNEHHNALLLDTNMIRLMLAMAAEELLDSANVPDERAKQAKISVARGHCMMALRAQVKINGVSSGRFHNNEPNIWYRVEQLTEAERIIAQKEDGLRFLVASSMPCRCLTSIKLRFPVGTHVQCRLGANPDVWVTGVITQHWYREPNWPQNHYVPYQIKIDDGVDIFAPSDVDSTIRLDPDVPSG